MIICWQEIPSVYNVKNHEHDVHRLFINQMACLLICLSTYFFCMPAPPHLHLVTVFETGSLCFNKCTNVVLYAFMFWNFHLYFWKRRDVMNIELWPEGVRTNIATEPDLWRAEPCFAIRSLHVLRSSTLLPSVLRADWTSEF